MDSTYIVIRRVLVDIKDIAVEIANIISDKEWSDVDKVISTLNDVKKSSLYNSKTSVFMMKFSLSVRDMILDSKIVKLLMKYTNNKNIRYIDGPPSIILHPPLYTSKNFMRMSVADAEYQLYGIMCVRGNINMKFIKSAMLKANKSKQTCCILYEFYNPNYTDDYKETEVILKAGDMCLWRSDSIFSWSNPSSDISSIAINISVCNNFVSYCEWNLDTNVYKISGKLYNIEEYDYRVKSVNSYSQDIHNKFMVAEDKSRSLTKRYNKRIVMKPDDTISLSSIVKNSL